MEFSKKIKFGYEENTENVKPLINPLKEYFNIQDQYYEKDMGTTIMAICYDGGVMLGADTRTSSGTYVANRVADKIWPVSNNIFCLKAGSAADTQFLIQLTKNYISQLSIELNDNPPVCSAARVLQQLQYEYKDYLSAAVICCGWDKINGPQIYSVGMGGSTLKQDFAMSGSGSAFIYGFVDTNYKKNMSKQECKELIVKAISLAMYRDNSSGGIVRLLDINKEGYHREAIRFDDLFIPK